jgi:hypothetical protein
MNATVHRYCLVHHDRKRCFDEFALFDDLADAKQSCLTMANCDQDYDWYVYDAEQQTFVFGVQAINDNQRDTA